MKETAKVFKGMGNLVGIPAVSKSQRGPIAREYMKRSREFELAEFEKKMIDMTPRHTIKQRDMKGNITWI